MNKYKTAMALAYAALASQAINPGFSPTPIDTSPTPEWKRKKCKSCKFISSAHPCEAGKYARAGHQACEKYKKRK